MTGPWELAHQLLSASDRTGLVRFPDPPHVGEPDRAGTGGKELLEARLGKHD